MKTANPILTCRSLIFLAIIVFALQPSNAIAWQENGRGGNPETRRRRSQRSWDVSLILISTGDVQSELDITPAQGELLEALGEDLGAQRRGRRGERRNASEDDRYRRAMLPNDSSESCLMMINSSG